MTPLPLFGPHRRHQGSSTDWCLSVGLRLLLGASLVLFVCGLAGLTPWGGSGSAEDEDDRGLNEISFVRSVQGARAQGQAPQRGTEELSQSEVSSLLRCTCGQAMRRMTSRRCTGSSERLAEQVGGQARCAAVKGRRRGSQQATGRAGGRGGPASLALPLLCQHHRDIDDGAMVAPQRQHSQLGRRRASQAVVRAQVDCRAPWSAGACGEPALSPYA
jgi:hypothetical protein